VNNIKIIFIIEIKLITKTFIIRFKAKIIVESITIFFQTDENRKELLPHQFCINQFTNNHTGRAPRLFTQRG
jgi:hypothetical protein